MGGAKYVHAARITSATSLSAGVQGLLEGPSSSKVLDSLSCYLSLIWKHSDPKPGAGGEQKPKTGRAAVQLWPGSAIAQNI